MEPQKIDRVLWEEMIGRLTEQFDRKIVSDTLLPSVIQNSLGQKLFAQFEDASVYVTSDASGNATVTLAENESDARITFSGNGDKWGLYGYVNMGDNTEQGFQKIIHAVSDQLRRNKDVPNAGLVLQAA